MTVLDVIFYPNDVLRANSEPVTVFGYALKKLISDMFETMDAYDGIGLAAPQISVTKQVLVVGHKSQRFALVNPEITSFSGVSHMEEGCLSLPGVLVDIERAESIVVRAKDSDGVDFEMVYSGLVATIVQHEIDHLKGVLITDLGTTRLQIDE